MIDPAAHVAQILRTEAKRQGLIGSEIADRVERQAGSRPIDMRVSRWLSGGQPLVRVHPDIDRVCAALGLDPAEVLAEAICVAYAVTRDHVPPPRTTVEGLAVTPERTTPA